MKKKYKSIITNPIARAAIPIKTVFLRPILEGKFAAKRKVRIDEMVKIITIVEAIPSSPKIFLQNKLLKVSIALKDINQSRTPISNTIKFFLSALLKGLFSDTSPSVSLNFSPYSISS